MKPRELRCFVCDRRDPPGTVGWESDKLGALDSHRDFCPKHRRDQPKAITTLGDMISAKKAKLWESIQKK